MSKGKILIVDDDPDILELLNYNLSKEGYQVFGASSGEEALNLLKRQTPELVLLDLMLPGIDGLEVCRTLKGDSKFSHIPVIMLTAKGEESDIIVGLELGADDYVTKPFSVKVLLARIKRIVRRGSNQQLDRNSTIQIYNLVINPGRHEVLADGELVSLTSTEFAILHTLAQRPGWVYTRHKIIEGVRGSGYPVTDRSVDVQIAGLRKKLGENGRLIETVRGIGYRFLDEK